MGGVRYELVYNSDQGMLWGNGRKPIGVKVRTYFTEDTTVTLTVTDCKHQIILHPTDTTTTCPLLSFQTRVKAVPYATQSQQTKAKET